MVERRGRLISVASDENKPERGIVAASLAHLALDMMSTTGDDAERAAFHTWYWYNSVPLSQNEILEAMKEIDNNS